MKYDVKTIMALVDHSSLKPWATESDIKRLMDEAAAFGNAAVCIEPINAAFARNYRDRMKYRFKIDTVIDFPFGNQTTDSRVMLIDKASSLSEEVDIVVQIPLVKAGKFDLIEKDAESVVKEAHRNGMIIKIITEDAYTTVDEKTKIYSIIVQSGADFIKTGTGFEDGNYASSIGNVTGALPENVRIMSEIARDHGSKIGIKAAGGIRTYDQIVKIIENSGRDPLPEKIRIGTSSTSKIYDEMIKSK